MEPTQCEAPAMDGGLREWAGVEEAVALAPVASTHRVAATPGPTPRRRFPVPQRWAMHSAVSP